MECGIEQVGSWLMNVDLLKRKQTAFVLWRPAMAQPMPKLVIGRFAPGNPPSLANRQEFSLTQIPGKPDLWSVDAAACGLTEGNVYHYWFEVTDSSPTRDGWRILCTDPTAST